MGTCPRRLAVRSRSGSCPRRLAVAFAGLLLAGGVPAAAHVIYGTTTVGRLTGSADLVVRARIAEAESVVTLEDPPLREVAVQAQVLAVWKGAPLTGSVLFVQHGHGVPKYEPGEEVVLFLQAIEGHRELGSSRLAKRVRWVSSQEAGEKYGLDDGSREAFQAAVRSYAELPGLPEQQRLDALRNLTVALLASPHPKLAASALRDVVFAGEAPLLTPGDVPLLEAVVRRPETPIGFRLGLLAELERRGLVEGPPRWAELLRATRGADRVVVARAAGAHPSPPVNRELLALLASQDTGLAATAAISLGFPGNDDALPALTQLLSASEPRLRMAAIRGLGGVATPGARAVLAETAATHPDAATRRRAHAEVTLLDERRPPDGVDPRGPSPQSR